MGNICTKKQNLNENKKQNGFESSSSSAVRNPLTPDKNNINSRLTAIPEDKSISEMKDYKTPVKGESDFKQLTTSNIKNINGGSGKSGVTFSPNGKQDPELWGETSSISTSRSNILPDSSSRSIPSQVSKLTQRSNKSGKSNRSGSSRLVTDAIPAEKTGYLYKRGQTLGQLVKRYYVLKNGILYSYSTEEESLDTSKEVPSKYEINLKGFNMVAVPDKNQFIFGSISGRKIILDVRNKFLYDSWNQKFVEHVAYANGYYHLVMGKTPSVS